MQDMFPAAALDAPHLVLRPSPRHCARSYKLGMGASAGIPLLFAVSALIRVAAHPSIAPEVVFSLGGLAVLALAPVALVMARQKITVEAGWITRRGLLRSRRWRVEDVFRIYRGGNVSGWTTPPMRYIYLVDHQGSCIIRVEVAWWFPEDAGERLSAALHLPIYVLPRELIPGSLPRFVRHPWLYGFALTVPILAAICVLIAVANQLTG